LQSPEDYFGVEHNVQQLVTSSPTVGDSDVLEALRQVPADSAAAAPLAPEHVPVRTRRPRRRNWELAEILAFIRAKASKHHALQNIVEARVRMEKVQQKWMGILRAVMAKGVSLQERDDSACMTKWNSLYRDFKKIKDYHAGTGHNLLH
jgi:hypothetical protein